MAKTKLPTVEEYTEIKAQRHAAIRRILQTEDGKKLMQEMEETFDGSLVKRYEGRGVDEAQTFINVGGREVVHFLRAIRDDKDRGTT